MDDNSNNLVCVNINNEDVYFEVPTKEERTKILQGR